MFMPKRTTKGRDSMDIQKRLDKYTKSLVPIDKLLSDLQQLDELLLEFEKKLKGQSKNKRKGSNYFRIRV